MPKHPLTRQIEILHVSDLHFGPKHRFRPPAAADGSETSSAGVPSLLEHLLEDLKVVNAAGGQVRRVLCVTGDLTESGSFGELRDAADFVRGLAESPEARLLDGLRSTWVVPGNHDLIFAEGDEGARWREWERFPKDLSGEDIATPACRADRYARVVDRSHDLGVIVACFNSAYHVHKGSRDEQRGQIDTQQRKAVREALERIQKDDPESFRNAIRIAMLHHHPLLIPPLVEPGRGYDAVVDGAFLLQDLQTFGFHAILHGHKHHPFSFVEDIDDGWVSVREPPLHIVAGGSVGSTSLAAGPRARNTYNLVRIKWHPDADLVRTRVTTRSLVCFDQQDRPLSHDQWTWETQKVDDRWLGRPGSSAVPGPVRPGQRDFDANTDAERDARRIGEYTATRGNLPVVEVRPSLEFDQAYEARFWIVGHKRRPENVPLVVRWSAGKHFPVVEVRREDDRFFCASFQYYDSMLIQAEMLFDDGVPSVAFAHVYARIPGDNREG